VKKQLRQQIRDRLAAVRPADLQARSAAACRLLCETDEYRHSDVIMIFLSMPLEVDTSFIAIQAWRDGKRILAPRVSWEQRRMLPVEIQSLTTDVEPGPMGIREPTEGMPVPVLDIDLVVVPGLAFDERGNRLGRGRGFYDRFLQHKDMRAVSCALALEDQIVPEVPVGEHDKRVDMIVTDARVRRFGR
jgi:5-formyltetrahydrofolate cyclo-ligase